WQPASATLEADLTAKVKDKAALKATADEMKAALAELDKRKAEADRRLAESRKLLAQLRSMIDAGKLKVKIVDGRMVLALATDVLFASGSAELSPGGLATINEATSVPLTIPGRKFQAEARTPHLPLTTSRFPS